MDKLNRVAANLGFDKAIAAFKAAEAQSQDPGETAARGGKRKNALGGRRKPLKRLNSAKEIQAFPGTGFAP